MAEDQDNELQDTSNPDDSGEQTQETTEEVDVEALKAKAEKADEYKKFADRTAAENKTLKKQLKDKPQEVNQSPISDEKYERLELKTDGYSSDEVETIMELGGLKALENPIVKEAISVMRKKAKSQDATPTGTAKSPIYQKYTERDLKSMPLAELEKIIPNE